MGEIEQVASCLEGHWRLSSMPFLAGQFEIRGNSGRQNLVHLVFDGHLMIGKQDEPGLDVPEFPQRRAAPRAACSTETGGKAWRGDRGRKLHPAALRLVRAAAARLDVAPDQFQPVVVVDDIANAW